MQINPNQKMKTLILACLYNSFGKGKEAIILLNDIFQKDRYHILYNALLSIFYQIQKKEGLFEKYMCIAQR